MLTRRIWQPCCAVSSVTLTSVRTVRRRAARALQGGGPSGGTQVVDSFSDPATSTLSTTISSTSSQSSLQSTPHSLSLDLPSLGPPQAQFPKAVYGLTEEKLQELASSMPPVLSRRENVIVLPTPDEAPKVKKSPQVTEENQARVLAGLYTPLYHVPYQQQLQDKDRRAGIILRRLKKRISEVCRLRLPVELPRLPCPLHPILPAPVQEQYRSEDTFTVWRGLDGNPKTVGLLTGDTKAEGTVCLPPSSLISVKTKHKEFCQAFQDYIRSSPHPAFLDYHTSRGVWRGACVRTTERGDTLASVNVFPHLLDEEAIVAIQEELEDYFTKGPGASIGLSALYLRVSDKTHRCRHRAPYIQVFGPSLLLDTFAGVACRVLPDSALPINPAAEEMLVTALKQATDMTPESTLLYIGAGSGHISLPLSKDVRRVVCLESSPSATEDAVSNMTRNNIVNSTFLTGSLEKELSSVLADLNASENVVAIVSCGHKALNPHMISLLRKTLSISQLMLLTTKPDGYILSNCVSFGNHLQGSRLSRYPPLLPNLAFCLDVAPHTPDFLMGILLTRADVPASPEDITG